MTSPETLERTVYADPATRFVRSLPGTYFMLREVAHACNVSQFTLRKFIADDVKECVPSKYTMFGKIKIYLYTREDIESIQHYLDNQVRVFDHEGPAKKMGRPATYSKPERDKRSRLYSKQWYWKNRAKILQERGDIAGSKEATKRADDIGKELKK